ncbi:MAG: hypothetical protein K0R60_2049 [Microbacterium sp.]|nr:hypothetical protein [Microbacterium sp.]
MHEHVEARERLGERAAGEVPREHRIGQRPLERGTRRAVADDHQARALGAGERGQVFHLLLGRQAADVAHDRAAGGDARAPCLAPSLRAEAGGVDAASPSTQPVDAEGLELLQRRRRRGQREGGAPVQTRDVASDEGRGLRHPVLLRVRDDVGLIDRDRRHAERVGGGEALPAQHERRRQVHDVRLELAEDRRQARGAREDDAHLGVRRQRRGPQQLGAGAVEVGGDLAGARRDDEGLVAFGGEMTEDVEHRTRHPVHVGQERFGE